MAWGARCSHSDTPVPLGDCHPLPAAPVTSCRVTKLTRFPWRCHLYRWCLFVEGGGQGGSIPGGKMLLAKLFFGGAPYILLAALGPV